METLIINILTGAHTHCKVKIIKSLAFSETIRDCYLYQHVTKPTRGRSGDQPSTIDLILTNKEHMITKLNHQAPLGKTDHTVLICTYKCYFEPSKVNGKRYLYNKEEYANMRAHLNNINWEELLNACPQDVDGQYNILTKEIQELQNKHIRLVDVSQASNRHKVPLSGDVRKAIRKKNRAYQRYLEIKIRNAPQHRTADKWREYTKLRNKASKLVRKAKKRFESDLAKSSKTNPKKFWRYAQSKLKNKSGVAEL